ncbi:hypothetical protein F8M41_021505 [Gigaspora margarita]|uniref:Uncharacterized protein n=1 Tax=Gigaspora margarita TaxID=4874 RepID=A0A8H4AGS5_GIGMA|nr:hypothetical protein F8M41_021505 [Gigaspora margarita]
MLDISSEPRVAGSRFSNSIISSEAYNVDDFFKSTPASEWLLGSYVNGIIEGPRHGGQGVMEINERWPICYLRGHTIVFSSSFFIRAGYT